MLASILLGVVMHCIHRIVYSELVIADLGRAQIKGK